MKKQWHISIAEYDKKVNAVMEDRLFDFDDFSTAFELFDAISHLPVYLWHDLSSSLNNPHLAIIETNKYKEEYNKIYD